MKARQINLLIGTIMSLAISSTASLYAENSKVVQLDTETFKT